jgi:hypothetical protein
MRELLDGALKENSPILVSNICLKQTTILSQTFAARNPPTPSVLSCLVFTPARATIYRTIYRIATSEALNPQAAEASSPATAPTETISF